MGVGSVASYGSIYIEYLDIRDRKEQKDEENLYILQNITVVKSRRMGWTEHVARNKENVVAEINFRW